MHCLDIPWRARGSEVWWMTPPCDVPPDKKAAHLRSPAPRSPVDPGEAYAEFGGLVFVPYARELVAPGSFLCFANRSIERTNLRYRSFANAGRVSSPANVVETAECGIV